MKKRDARIEFVDLDEVQRWPRNPKQHSEKTLMESVERFGFIEPLIMDEKTGRIVAGHGRLDVLQKMRTLRREVPAGVKVDGDKWKVPIIRGISFADEREAEAYLIATNRIVETGGWKEDELLAMLKDAAESAAGLEGVGWNDSDMAVLAASSSFAAEAGTPVTDPAGEWEGMPEFQHEDKMGLSILVRFKDAAAQQQFEALIGRKLPGKAKYLWYPEMVIETFVDKRYVAGKGEPEAAAEEGEKGAGE